LKIFKRIGLFFLLFFLFLFLSPPGFYYLFKDPRDSSFSFPSEKEMEGVGVYLINLDRSHQRYRYVWPSLQALGFPLERVSAVDGRTLTEAEITSVMDKRTFKKFFSIPHQLGTIGCYLSHIKVWKKFLQSPFKFALVFEDDVSFSPQELSETVHHLIAPEQVGLWDINSFELNHRGMPLTIKKLPHHQSLCLYLTPVTHTGAYLINRKAAQALLEKALPIKMPVDHYFTRVWEFSLKFTGIEPRLVKQSYGDSEIRSLNSPNPSPSLYFLFQRAIYLFQSQAIRFFYNLKVYFS
jgi:glycosyl transferase family 25